MARYVHAQSALAYIRGHHFTASITEDGLLAFCDTRHVDSPDDDAWWEEPTVFPIDGNGRVDGHAVSLWLGY